MQIRLFGYVMNINKSFGGKKDKKIKASNMSVYKDGFYWYLTCEKLGLKRVCLLTSDEECALKVAKEMLQNELISCNRAFAAFYQDKDTFNMKDTFNDRLPIDMANIDCLDSIAK